MRKSGYRFTLLAAAGLLLSMPGGPVMAGPWDMDTTYGQGGTFKDDLWNMVGRPDGSLLQQTRTASALVLKRIDANGSQDPGFGTAGQLEFSFPDGFEVPYRLPAVDGAGRYLWCGRMDVNGDGVGDMVILRFTTAGKPDPGFGVGGVVSRATDPLPPGTANKDGDWCQSLAIQADGKIVAGIVHAAAAAGASVSRVRRFNSDGSDDVSFGGGTGSVSISSGYSYPEVQALPDGWILVVTTDAYGDNVQQALLDSTGMPGPDPWTLLPGNLVWLNLLGSPASGNFLLVGQDAMEKLVVARVLPDGTLDKAFGNSGTGIVKIDPMPPAVIDAWGGGYNAYLSQDGQRLYLSYRHYGPDGLVSGEIGRVHAQGLLAGQRDESFGIHGSIPFSFAYFSGLWEQSPGNLLVSGNGDVFRLSASSGPSPGIIGVLSTSIRHYSTTDIAVQAGRFAGHDGAVSISFKTADDPGAQPGMARIYEPASGQLQWADGDSALKSIAVHVLPQTIRVNSGFGLMLENSMGGALLQNSQVNIWVDANAPVVTPPLPANVVPADSPGYSSGGGSADVLSLLMLLLGAGAVLRARVRSNLN